MTEEHQLHLADSPPELAEVWPVIFSEQMISDYLKLYVKGQSEIIDKLSFLGFSYTLQMHAQHRDVRKSSMPKLNMLITGPTGFGKTYIVKKFAEAIGTHYMKIDCSSVTGEGWHGASISDYLATYLEMSPSGFGVLHLDEVDKLAVSDSHREYKHSMQNSLLDLLDGQYMSKTESSSGKYKDLANIANINNCLIILTGSFQTSREEEKNKKYIGFKHDIEDKKEINYKDKMSELGFLSEFAGRIVCAAELEKYDRRDIRELIVRGLDSSYNKYRNLYGVDKFLTEDEMDEVIEKVYNSKTGLRELESLLFDKCYRKRSMR